jgi:hypothetical protein
VVRQIAREQIGLCGRRASSGWITNEAPDTPTVLEKCPAEPTAEEAGCPRDEGRVPAHGLSITPHDGVAILRLEDRTAGLRVHSRQRRNGWKTPRPGNIIRIAPAFRLHCARIDVQ